MKQEEHLERLFKAAKEEKTHFPYERLAQQFKKQTSFASVVKKLVSKVIHMNSLLIIIAGSFFFFLWYFHFPPTPSTIPIESYNISSKETISSELSNAIVSSTEEKETILPQIKLKTLQKTAIKKMSFVEKNEIPIPSIDSTFSASDTSKTFNIPPIFTIEKGQPVRVISENKLIPQPLKMPTIFYQFIEINWQDDPKQILKTKQAIADMGFEVKKLHTNRKQENIDKIDLHLTHQKGLDWKFTVTDFKKIELKIIIDDKVGLRAFAYRFNRQSDFGHLIFLTEQGSSKHRVASGTKGRHITRKKNQD